ncbi:Phenylalanine--tRNA ligase beta subunit, cytoplasmic [Vitis vinifera]|uniref:Phenylalanine--tRNA ligase beta subunit, cytoplasmic n=1 Tax=Vitis vinifera TaxID=29760 RepID=A0A438JZ83_VITVI|nr:Phenylalanine--tRNA ligase beta subunit, cytoplasmic [Vitis vinifera]
MQFFTFKFALVPRTWNMLLYTLYLGEIFEVGDIAVLDEAKDVGATNRRQLAALYCGANSGFELIHCLVDRIMEIIGCPFVAVGDDTGYYIKLSNEPEFLPGRQASIIYRGKHIGTFGIVHPELMEQHASSILAITKFLKSLSLDPEQLRHFRSMLLSGTQHGELFVGWHSYIGIGC